MYKRDQGKVTRTVSFLLFLLGGLYAGYCFYYYWRGMMGGYVAMGFSMALLVATAAWGWNLSFRKPRTGDFLIDLDGEMRKVVWPAVKPLFDPKTEAWGSTYVVIACTIVFTIIIFALDAMLGFGIQRMLFQGWLFAPAA